MASLPRTKSFRQSGPTAGSPSTSGSLCTPTFDARRECGWFLMRSLTHSTRYRSDLKRTAATQQFSRFRREADIQQAALTEPDLSVRGLTPVASARADDDDKQAERQV